VTQVYRIYWIVTFVFFTGTIHLAAQDYERQKPKEPESTATPATVPEGKTPAASGSTAVMIPKLHAIVFVDSLNKVKTEPASTTGLVTNGIPLLQQPGFSDIVQPYLDKPLTMQSLHKLVADIVLWCREQDHPIIDVVVPQQDITNGVLQLIFIEGRVGEVKVQGNKWFSSKDLREEIRLRSGDDIRASQLESDVNWINRNPFHTSNILFTPSKETGRTDIILDTKDRFPVRPYVGYENTGNTLTGEDRYEAGFNWGDAFFLGHQLNYQYMTSGDNTSLTAHSGSYIMPLPWRHTLTLFGSISDSQTTLTDFTIKGSGAQLGFRYDIPLPGITSLYDHSVQFGYDWKQSDNSLEFGSIPVNTGTTDIQQVVFGYQAKITDPLGTTSVNPQVFWSPGHFDKYQSDTAYNTSRSGASSEYSYLRFEMTRTTRLPADFSLFHDFQWQVSDGNLLPSEQLQFGGSQSIRGYNEWDLSGTDEGWLIRNELRFPTLSFGKIFGEKAYQDQLQLLTFFDYGQAWSHRGQITLNNGKAQDHPCMASVGPGLRYTINSYLSLKTDYGFQLDDTGDLKGSRWAISAILSY